MSVRDPLAEWSALLFESLARAGVQEVVVSPGSRSTPFVIAAAQTPGLRCWDVVDERSAAFFALGQAKATGRPSLCLCTSGSAGAHYLPALLEAEASHTPLLLLTADRPLELQACAAPQTLDQVKLFGDHVRAFFELGLPDATALALRALRRSAAQAVLTSRWPLSGPVHLNARARKPLEPYAPVSEVERDSALHIQGAAELQPPVAFPPRALPSTEGAALLAATLAAAKAPLFVAGPGPLMQSGAAGSVAALVRRSGGVLLAEAASQFRFASLNEVCAAPAFDAYVGQAEFAAQAKPDLIIQIGAAPTSSAFDAYLQRLPPVPQWVLAPQGWNDPDSRASQLLFGDLSEIAKAVAEQLPARQGAGLTAWQQTWQAQDRSAQDVLSELSETAPVLVEGSVAREVVRSLRSGGRLFVGNSLPIREVDLFCTGPEVRCDVLSQRGANGIDGLISGAAGAASSGSPVTLLLGDVSFLHDLGGLWAAKLVGAALTIVVLQNRGGRIFEDLPLAKAGVNETLPHFTTPHTADFAAAAAVYGLRHVRVETRAELQAALAEPAETCRIIEAIVPERGLGNVRRQLADRLARARS